MLKERTIDFDEINSIMGDWRNEFGKLSPENQKYKIEDTIKMIEYHRTGTDAIEERRNRIYENALTIMGVIVAALTIIYSINPLVKESPSIILFFVFLYSQLVVQLLTVILYYAQSARGYPFNNSSISDNNYSNQWKWFYRGNKDIIDLNIGTFSIFSSKETNDMGYLTGLVNTIKNHLSEDVESEYFSDITQMYLLMVHNAYKNRYYLELMKLQRWGGIISLILLVLCFFILLVI